MDSIESLRAFLATQSAGSVTDKRVLGLLAECWGNLRGSGETSMRAEKLYRAEDLTWEPPNLHFSIERHGGTVNGSTRAALYAWSVNVETGEASYLETGHSQLYSADKRLDVKPIAEELAAAIRGGTPDRRLRVGKDGSVSLKISEIIPPTNKQTTSGRRSRLRRALRELLEPHGWKEKRANCYALEKGA